MLENVATTTSNQTPTPDSDSANVELAPPPEPCVPVNILINGSFEDGVVIPPGETWTTAPVAGWQNTGSPGNNIEIWTQAVMNVQTDGSLQTFGNYVVETDSTGSLNTNPGGIPVFDVLVTHVDAIEGETYDLSFNYTSRNIPDFVTPSNTDSFDVFWNGGLVGHFDPSNSLQWASSGVHQVVGGAGVDTLEIREAGANDSLGAVIDNVQLVGCACQEAT
jgi:hypothetical protein